MHSHGGAADFVAEDIISSSHIVVSWDSSSSSLGLGGSWLTSVLFLLFVFLRGSERSSGSLTGSVSTVSVVAISAVATSKLDGGCAAWLVMHLN